MRNFVITVNGAQYQVAVEEVAAGAAPVAAAPVAAPAPAAARDKTACARLIATITRIIFPIIPVRTAVLRAPHCGQAEKVLSCR